jgi:2-aminobenzoate-CoA ligase
MRRCLLTETENWSYRDLYERVNRLAHVLVDEMGLVPGNRVLLRAPNTPMMVCAYLAVIKAGGIAVGTMPLLRAGELAPIIAKAEIGLALTDARLVDELTAAQGEAPALRRIACFGTAAADGLEAMMATKPASFGAYDSAANETCLIAFTSGTTGVPKGTMHFHRDLISICRGSSGLILEPTADDL